MQVAVDYIWTEKIDKPRNSLPDHRNSFCYRGLLHRERLQFCLNAVDNLLQMLRRASLRGSMRLFSREIRECTL